MSELNSWKLQPHAAIMLLCDGHVITIYKQQDELKLLYSVESSLLKSLLCNNKLLTVLLNLHH